MISCAMKNVGQFSIGQLHCPTNLRIKRTICKIWLPIAEQKIPKSHAIAILREKALSRCSAAGPDLINCFQIF